MAQQQTSTTYITATLYNYRSGCVDVHALTDDGLRNALHQAEALVEHIRDEIACRHDAEMAAEGALS